MPAPALLGRDPTYWQSVHQAGQGLLKERQEAAKKEKDAWQAKVKGTPAIAPRWLQSQPQSFEHDTVKSSC